MNNKNMINKNIEEQDKKKWMPRWVAIAMLFLWPFPLIIILLIWS